MKEKTPQLSGHKPPSASYLLYRPYTSLNSRRSVSLEPAHNLDRFLGVAFMIDLASR